MASAAVAFTADPLAPQSDCNALFESKRAHDDNIVAQLNRAYYATVGSYFQAQSPSPSSSDEMCPLEIGTLTITEQFLCQAKEQHADGSMSASQAAAMLGGTLAAALLVYSLLPYVRARNRQRRHSRSRTLSQTDNRRLSACKDQQEMHPTPTSPNGASRRMWGSLEDDGIEPAGACRDERRERKSRQLEAKGSAMSDAGSELLLAMLPDFNDERGWRDFFDSQIYHSESHVEHRTPTKAFSGIKNRGDGTPRTSIAATRTKKTTAATAKSDRYKTIRDRIDRAAMEAAIDEAESFNEFWQL